MLAPRSIRNPLHPRLPRAGTALAFLCACACAAPCAPGAATAAPTQADQRRFDVEEYRVEGNTVLPAIDIERTVTPFLGPGRTPADIEHARQALSDLYDKRGYPTVSVELPRQQVTDGVVAIHVTERRVGRLRVVGSRYFRLDRIREGAPSLAEGTVPNLNAIKSDIVGLNQWPDRTVTPALKAGRAPDTVDVDLQVTDHLPLHGSVELNNRQQVDTKPLRAQAALSYGNLWQRGDSASVSFQLAPEQPSQSEVLAASYLFRIPDSQLALLASYTHSNSNVRTLSTTAALGSGDTIGLRLQVPLWFQPGFTQSLSTGLDYKSYRQTLSLSGTSSETPLVYYPFAITYSAGWSSEEQITNLVASFIIGSGIAGSNTGVFDRNRFAATPNFSYVRATLDHTHELPFGTQGYARVQVQLTGDALVPQEQLSLGGLDSVRGYYETEALVDYGGGIQTELRSPQLAALFHDDGVNDARVHVFGDAASGAIHHPLPQQTSSYVLGSVGFGGRVQLYDYFHAELENALVLSPGPNTKSGADRVLFRIFGEF